MQLRPLMKDKSLFHGRGCLFGNDNGLCPANKGPLGLSPGCRPVAVPFRGLIMLTKRLTTTLRMRVSSTADYHKSQE